MRNRQEVIRRRGNPEPLNFLD